MVVGMDFEGTEAGSRIWLFIRLKLLIFGVYDTRLVLPRFG